MGDRGIGQETLDVPVEEVGDASPEHRGQGDHLEDRALARLEPRKSGGYQLDQDGEYGRFGGRGKEDGHRCRHPHARE